MKQLLIIPVILLGLLAGVAVAGRPTTVPHDVTFAEIPPIPVTTMPMMEPATTALPQSAPVETSNSDEVSEPLETGVVSSEPSPFAAAGGSETAVIPVPEPTSPSTTVYVRPLGDVFLVVANASNTFGLATGVVGDLETDGYDGIIRTDGLVESDTTAIYYRPGYDAEAARLADQIGFTGSVQPLPSERRYRGTANPEVMLWLGNDWSSTTNLQHSPG